MEKAYFYDFARYSSCVVLNNEASASDFSGKRHLVERGKDVLLALSQRLSGLKKKIFRLYILRILISADATIDKIRERLGQEYGISLDGLILDQLLYELRRDNLIECGGLYFRIKDDGRELVKQLDDARKEEYSEILDYIADRVPIEHKEEVVSKRKEIASDIIFSFSKVIDKHFYESHTSLRDALDHLIRAKPEVNCYIREDRISEGLRTELKKIYNDLWQNADSTAFEKILNTALFWSTFIRISMYDKDVRNELIKELEATRILLDTNILVANCCHFHPMHREAVENIRFLRSLGVKLCYTVQTKEELERYLSPVRRAVRFLENYPAEAVRVAVRTGNPALQGYFRERFLSWESYYDGFMRKINRDFELFIEDSSVRTEAVQEAVASVRSRVMELMDKGSKVAEHDAYLAALVRELRTVHEDWFKLVSWVLTIDLRLFKYDRFLWDPEEPTSIFLTRIPYYFSPYGIAKAIQQPAKSEAVAGMVYVHETLTDAVAVIKSWKVDVDAEISSLVKVKDISDLQNMILQRTLDLLKTEGV